jgi:TfoX/Sxy family transcriptional regulator of competence genes
MAYDEDLADRLRAALQHQDGVEEKRMFGGLAFLVGGHMAVAASGQGGLMVRCDPDRTTELLEQPGAATFEMRGRAMKGWLRVDIEAVSDDADLQRWVDVGVGYVATLPPK